MTTSFLRERIETPTGRMLLMPGNVDGSHAADREDNRPNRFRAPHRRLERLHMTSFLLERIETPTGRMLLITDDADRALAADWEENEERMRTRLGRRFRGNRLALRETCRASAARRGLEAYFAGDLNALAQVSVEAGGTPFQRAVWDALRQIPAGETASYREVAERIRRPSAVRAVGMANASNPIAILIPCHRVIGTDARLTGYAGGLERKRWLLAHEGARAGSAAAGRRRSP